MQKTQGLRSQPAISAPVWGMLLLLGLLWGGSFFFARLAVQEVAPFTLVFLRVSIAAAALHIWLAASGEWRLIRDQPFVPFLLLGLLNNAIPFSLLFFGQTELGAGLASILNAMVPFWTVLGAQMLTADERLTPSKIIGIALGVAGAAVLIGPAAASGLGAPLWAKFAVLAAGISYALASIYAKRFKTVPPAVTAAGQLTASTLIMLPVSLLTDGMWRPLSISPKVWLAVLALALISTAIAYILYFRITASAGATVVSLVTLLVPASAVMLGTLFLGEELTLPDLGGMALIGLGLLTIDGRLSRLVRRA